MKKSLLLFVLFAGFRLLSDAQCTVKSIISPRDTVIDEPGGYRIESRSTDATSYDWAYQFGLSASDQSYLDVDAWQPSVYTIRLIAKNGSCIDTSYTHLTLRGTTPPGENFRVLYGMEGITEDPKFIIAAPDSGYLIGSEYVYYDKQSHRKLGSYVIRISKTGCMLWSKTYLAAIREEVRMYAATTTRDGGFVISAIANLTKQSVSGKRVCLFLLNRF